jgi:hypothetical protein
VTDVTITAGKALNSAALAPNPILWRAIVNKVSDGRRWPPACSSESYYVLLGALYEASR